MASKDWTEEQKKIIYDYVLVAQDKGYPLTQAFALAAEELEERESSIGVLYYNYLRKDLSEQQLPSEDRQKELSQVFLASIRKEKDNARRQWQQEEDDLIIDTVRANKERHLMDVCNELGEVLENRTPLAISRRFYTIRDKKEFPPPISRNSWTAEEDALLLEAIDEGVSLGKPKTHIFKELAADQLSDRSEHAIQKRLTFIRPASKPEQAKQEIAASSEDIPAEEVNDDSGQDSQAPIEQASETPTESQEVTVNREVLEVLGQLPEAMAGIQSRLTELEKREIKPDVPSVVEALITMSDGYKERNELKAQMEDIREQHKESLSALNSELKKVSSEKKDLLKQYELLYEKMAEAEGVFETFINMASVAQVMSLGDFKCKMKSVIDRWGNVVKVNFEREAQR